MGARASQNDGLDVGLCHRRGGQEVKHYHTGEEPEPSRHHRRAVAPVLRNHHRLACMHAPRWTGAGLGPGWGN